MKRTNDQIHSSNDGRHGDLSKKPKVAGKMIQQYGDSSNMSRGTSMAHDSAYNAMYGGGVDHSGIMMMNPSFGVGGGGMMFPGVPNVMAEPGRAIYLGGITDNMQPQDIFNVIKTGNVEFLRILREKGCAFLCFVDPMAAEVFYQRAKVTPLQIKGVEIKVGWAKSNPVNHSLQEAIRHGVTRTVYIDHLAPEMDSDYLMSALSTFGEIETIKILKEKNIAFISFTNIPSALNCVNALSNDPFWAGRRINYGKDRCNMTNQHHQQQQQQQLQLQPFDVGNYGGYSQLGMTQAPKLDRTIYIGNLKETDTCEDICSAIRGGQIYFIRLLKEKCAAFVTFVDPYSATLLHAHGNTIGLAVNGRRVKVAWGKPAAIPYSIMAAILEGATRNVYLGGVTDPIPMEELENDFSKYGELEMIKHIPDKKCYFINFTSINSAMKARKEIQTIQRYRNLRVNYGKDRCAKPMTLSDNSRIPKIHHRQEGSQSSKQKEEQNDHKQQSQQLPPAS